jgi:hypothetical protein
MSNRLWKLLGLVTAGLVAGSAGWHWSSREPVYQGKPLSFWVQQLPLRWTVSNDLPAVKALRQIGTNAVPYLLDTIRSGYPAYKTRLARVTTQLNRELPFLHLHVVSEFERWHRSFRALRVLGNDARPAIPELAVMLNSGQYSRTRGDFSVEAAWVLANIRPEGLDCLIAATTNRNAEVRRNAIEALGSSAPASPEVVSALVKVLTDDDSDVRVFGARALMNVHAYPVSAVPAFVLMLVDPEADVRQAAADALANYGYNASTNALSRPFPH